VEFAALLARIETTSPQFTSGLAELMQRIGQEITEERNQNEAQL
jgi:hypothetical protein